MTPAFAVSERWGALLLVAAVAACGRGREDRASGDASPRASGSIGPPEAPPPPKTGMVWIPGGALVAGTPPDAYPRLADEEMPGEQVILHGFYMDVFPFPNEEGAIPRTNVNRAEAAALCEERDKRLCTELEWERACKGPASDAYATGAAWDPRCSEAPQGCATGFDALAMGALREWTASDVVPTEKDAARRAALRGAGAKAPAHDHRCAARSGVDPATTSDDLGFRCCHGAPNAAVVKEATLGQTFERAKLSAEELQKLLAADPRTAGLAKDVKYFRDPDGANAVIERGSADKKGFTFSVAPLLWNPVAGAQYLLVAARSGDSTSFVVAFHVAGKDEYRLASSFVMKNEPGPVAFAYSGYIRPRLHFSTCWGCPGETGKLLHREPDAVVIVQP